MSTLLERVIDFYNYCILETDRSPGPLYIRETDLTLRKPIQLSCCAHVHIINDEIEF